MELKESSLGFYIYLDFEKMLSIDCKEYWKPRVKNNAMKSTKNTKHKNAKSRLTWH